MFAVGWDDMRRPPELNRWSAAHHNTLASPKMILTFTQSSLSHCGWAANNFTASCVAAATQLRQLHTQLISWTSLTSWLNATSQVRDVQEDAEIKRSFFFSTKKASLLSLPVLWSEWLRHLCGCFSSRGLLWQDYPKTGRELESRWSLRLRQVCARWAVEEEWPVFIKLMNVWSYSSAPWRAIWASERGMVRC